jgi:hypothetical protein
MIKKKNVIIAGFYGVNLGESGEISGPLLVV